MGNFAENLNLGKRVLPPCNVEILNKLQCNVGVGLLGDS